MSSTINMYESFNYYICRFRNLKHKTICFARIILIHKKYIWLNYLGHYKFHIMNGIFNIQKLFNF